MNILNIPRRITILLSCAVLLVTAVISTNVRTAEAVPINCPGTRFSIMHLVNSDGDRGAGALSLYAYTEGGKNKVCGVIRKYQEHYGKRQHMYLKLCEASCANPNNYSVSDGPILREEQTLPVKLAPNNCFGVRGYMKIGSVYYRVPDQDNICG